MKKGFTKQDFYNMLKTDSNTGCMEWTGSKDKNGYGFTWVPEQKKIVRTHRFSLYLNGKIPLFGGNLQALHHCDNPKCCNPDHLYAGTELQNRRDSVSRNRQYKPKGELNQAAKLTEKEVREIYDLYYNSPMTQKEIREKYNVTRFAVYDIIAKRTWKHLWEDEDE